MTVERPAGAAQDGELVALDVDLQRRDPPRFAPEVVVQRDDRNRDAAPGREPRDRRLERRARRRRVRTRDVQGQGAGGVRDSGRLDDDVGQPRRAAGPEEVLREDGLRLERHDLSGPRGPRQRRQEAALVRPDVHRDVSRADRARERRDLGALVAQPGPEAAVEEAQLRRTGVHGAAGPRGPGGALRAPIARAGLSDPRGGRPDGRDVEPGRHLALLDLLRDLRPLALRRFSGYC